MNPEPEEFLSQLEQLRPDSNDYLESDLYELTGPLRNGPKVPELLETLFRFMEAHPEADFGAPGPLVHLIEQHRGAYEQLLSESVNRNPMYTTLHMLNRLLNTDLTKEERERWLSTLKMIAANTTFSEKAREQAELYLGFHHARD